MHHCFGENQIVGNWFKCEGTEGMTFNFEIRVLFLTKMER